MNRISINHMKSYRTTGRRPIVTGLLSLIIMALATASGFAQTPEYNKTTLNEESYVVPALRFANCRLYVAWTGTDQRLNIASSTDGIHFSNKRTFNEYSYSPPALAASSTGRSTWRGAGRTTS